MTSFRGKLTSITIVVILALVLALYGSGLLAPEPTVALNDLHGIVELQRLFNQDADFPRLVLVTKQVMICMPREEKST